MDIKIDGINIKEIQNAQLELAIEFDRICRKHDLKYQMYSGTLLGAVRHKGFIPWDDDLDVCMLRKDYERFVQLCETDLNAKYFCQTPESDKNYLLQLGKLRKNETLFVEQSFASEDIHHGIYIDIFPFDNIEIDTFKAKLQKTLSFILNRLTLVRSQSIVDMAPSKGSKFMRQITRFFVKLIPLKWIKSLQLAIATMFNDKDTEYITDIVSGADNYTYPRAIMKRSEFYQVRDFEFEHVHLLGPVHYDEVLKNNFGDYMTKPPFEERKPHHNIMKIDLNSGS